MNEKFQTPLHLILDGSDNLGKTTVANILSRKLNLPIIKMPRTQEYFKLNLAEEFSKFFNETLIQFNEFSFIMDRGFPSSLVYGKKYKRKFDLSYIENIEKILKPKVFIFYSENKNSFCKDLIITETEKLEISIEYQNLAYKKGYYLLNVDDKSPIDLCNEILENL